MFHLNPIFKSEGFKDFFHNLLFSPKYYYASSIGEFLDERHTATPRRCFSLETEFAVVILHNVRVTPLEEKLELSDDTGSLLLPPFPPLRRHFKELGETPRGLYAKAAFRYTTWNDRSVLIDLERQPTYVPPDTDK